jgi:hypothetical protein
MKDRPDEELLRRRLAVAKASVPPPSDEERKARYDARAAAGDRGRSGWGKPGGKPPEAPAAPGQGTFRAEEDEAAAIAAAMNEVERAERARAGRRKAAFYAHFVPWAALSAALQAKLVPFSTLDAEDHLAQADQVAAELGLEPDVVRELARRLEQTRTHRRQDFAARRPAARRRGA